MLKVTSSGWFDSDLVKVFQDKSLSETSTQTPRGSSGACSSENSSPSDAIGSVLALLSVFHLLLTR